MNKLSFSFCLFLLFSNLCLAQGIWLNKNSAPSAAKRHECSFVKSGDKFYLLGGRSKKPVYIYNTTSGTWTSGATPPVELHHFQAVEFNSKIYAIGAFTKSYNDTTQGFTGEKPVTSIYTYNPSTNAWVKGSSIPRPRGSAGAVVYNNKIYILGGQTQGHTGGHVTWFDEYNPSTNTWVTLPDAPRARDHFHAVVLGDKLYAVAGRRTNRFSSEGVWGNLVPEVDVYDFTLGKWLTNPTLPPEELLTIPNIPTLRAAAGTVAFGNEIIVMGGESNTSLDTAHRETEALDLNTLTWQHIGLLNQGRHGTQAIVHDNKIYMAAGAGKSGGTPELSTMEAFYREKNFPTWTELGKAPTKRVETQSIIYQNKIYYFNGFTTNQALNNTNEVYDPATNTWTALAPIPDTEGQPSGLTHAGVALVNDEVWLVGGRLNGQGDLTEKVWIYNISTNTWRQCPSLPAKHASGALAKLGRKLYFFGGGTHEAAQISSFCLLKKSHYVLDLDNPQATWQDVLAALPEGFERIHASVAVLEGNFYLIGGQDGHDCGNTDKNWVHKYNPYLNKWTRLADLPKANSHAEPGTFALDGKIISVGGEFAGEDVMQYNPQTDSWAKIDELKDDFGNTIKLIGTSAKVIENKMYVAHGGLNSLTAQANDQIFVKNFSRNPSNKMGFLPDTLSLTMDKNRTATKSGWLWTVSGSVNYSIDLNNLPSWLSVSKDTGNVVDETAVEFEISFNSDNLPDGNYTHQLTATAAGYTDANLNIILTVQDVNILAQVNAGKDTLLVLPKDSITLIGTATDPDGIIIEKTWTQQSGPNTAEMEGIHGDILKVSNLIQGVYVFKLSVTDDENGTAFDEVSLTVSNPAVHFSTNLDSITINIDEIDTLTNFLSTNNNTDPQMLNLSAIDNATSTVPTWLKVNGNLLAGINFTTGSEINFEFNTNGLQVGNYTATVSATAANYESATINLVLNVVNQPKIAIIPNELIFDGLKNTTIGPKSLTIQNTGGNILTISSVSIIGTNPDKFNTTATPISLNPNESTTVQINFVPGATVGALSAELSFASNDPSNPSKTIGLYGLSANGLEVNSEPTLNNIVKTIGYNINVGWTTLADGTGANPKGDEILTPLFKKAGTGEVGILPVARYSPVHQIFFGYYQNQGGTAQRTQIGELLADAPHHQALFPGLATGTTTFTINENSVFGIFVQGLQGRFTYTEDTLNTGGPALHAARIYPLKDRIGILIPNTYLVCFEDATNGDYQDYVFVLSNVIPVSVLKFNPVQLSFSTAIGSNPAAQNSTLSANINPGTTEIILTASENWVALPSTVVLGNPMSFGINSTNLSTGNYTATITASATAYISAVMNINLTVSSELFTFYKDNDNDGFGKTNDSTRTASQPVGYVSNKTDCNDNDNTIYPNAPELCDGKDNNCNGNIDEGCTSSATRYEAETYYVKVSDVGSSSIVITTDALYSGGKDVRIYDIGDKIKIDFPITSTGQYQLKVRVRTGTTSSMMQLWPNGYKFTLDNQVHTFVGNTASLVGPTALNSYLGVMESANLNLTTGTHSLTIEALKAYARVDYLEVVSLGGGQVDNIAPTTPILSLNSKTHQSVSLSWTASTDNVGVTAYEVYNGTNLAGTTANLNFTVNDLNANTTYTFTVKAKDAAGNLSLASNILNVTTNGEPINSSTRYEAELNYVKVSDVGSSSIVITTDALYSGGKDVRIYDIGDKIKIDFPITSTGQYQLKVRVRTGTTSSMMQLWPNGYKFTLDNQVHTFVGNTASLVGPTALNSYLGVMESAVLNLTAGTHSLTIEALKAYARVDYLEVVSISSSSPSNVSEINDVLANEDNYFKNSDENQINIYPNPFAEIFTLEYTTKELNSKHIQISIYDSKGKLVVFKMIEGEFGKIETQLDVSELPRGKYILKLIQDKIVITRQIIRE